MTKDCEENNSKAIDNGNNGEDRLTDEVHSAASGVFSFQHAKLDKKSSARLNKQKRKFLGGEEQEEEASVGGRNNRMLDGYEPPDVPSVAGLAGLITGCCKPYQKRLTETDVRKNQSRLLFCNNMMPLLKEDENVGNGIPVVVYDGRGKEYRMKFKRWGSAMYVLTSSDWPKFCSEYKLAKDVDIVTVWMFRHRVTEKLCFVISCRWSPPPTIAQGKALHRRPRKMLLV
ncbi:hypothetical protein GQ457_08G023020 [Hibiscus cannabinus]